VNFGGVDLQTFSGEIAFTSGPGATGFNFLTVFFTNAVASGTDGQNSLALQGPTSLTFTSDTPGLPLGAPKSMSLSFSTLNPVLSIANASMGALGNTTMANSGTFGASAVPEPSTITLAGLGFGALGLISYLRLRRKPEGA
jgi:hypothetical protein